MKSKTYDEFVEKFKPKKTTDDLLHPARHLCRCPGLGVLGVRHRPGQDRAAVLRTVWVLPGIFAPTALFILCRSGYNGAKVGSFSLFCRRSPRGGRG